MLRPIGKYKDKDIIITELYMTGTYSFCLEGSYYDCNTGLIKDEISATIKRQFGLDIPYFVNYKRFDFFKSFPREIVYAHLSCGQPIKKDVTGAVDGSHLVWVWFQNHGQDPFATILENFTPNEWETLAEDFGYDP